MDIKNIGYIKKYDYTYGSYHWKKFENIGWIN